MPWEKVFINHKFVFGNLCLENSNEEVISGVTIVNKLIFESHMKNICRKDVQIFVHNREYLIMWKQTKKTGFQCHNKISIQ